MLTEAYKRSRNDNVEHADAKQVLCLHRQISLVY